MKIQIRSFRNWLLYQVSKIVINILLIFFQKDVMFRSAGANGTNGLYSPIANSDSSGFSEQRADLSSYSGNGSQGGQPGGYTTFNPAFRPVAGTGQGHIYDRSVFF